MKFKKEILVGCIGIVLVGFIWTITSDSKVMQTSSNKEITLEEAVNKIIMEKEDSGKYDFSCESNYVLYEEVKKEDNKEIITLYTMVTIREYEIKDNIFTQKVGDYFPLAITFTKENNSYVLREYWKPRKDKNFIPDLEEKFPKFLVQTAIGEPKFKVEDVQKCYSELIQYGDIDIEKMISQIIQDRITGNEFIIPHTQKFGVDELIYFGDYMLDYSFERFLEGSVEKKSAIIMSDVCRYILNQNNEDIIESDINGEEWFKAYYEEIKNIKEDKGIEYIKNNMPKAYKLIEIEKN